MALTRLGPNQSVNLASNVTGTLPTGNGGTGATSFAPGKILQIVQGSTTYSKTNSTQDSYTDAESSSGVTWVTSITPTSTSNKILIIASLMTNLYESSSEGDQRGHVAVLGDINGAGYSTLIDNYKIGAYAYGGTSYGSSVGQTTTFNYLWSPSTTSQCNVKFQFRPIGANGVAALSGVSGKANTCTLMEVSG